MLLRLWPRRRWRKSRALVEGWILLVLGREYPYTGFPCPDFLKISGAMYPGVPQVVVKT